MTEASAGCASSRTIPVLRDARAVDEARRLAAAALGDGEGEWRHATMLVIAELADNIVKYGAASGAEAAGTITLDVEGGRVRVRSENLVEADADGRHVVDAIARLAGASATDLYRTRMRELFVDPTLPRARLGLLRVALEGGFRLSCSYRARLLEIVAERSVDAP